MKNQINNILSKAKELANCENMIFEKENDILSCVKAVGEEGVRMRQKNAAVSLLNLKNKKAILQGEISELCKSLDLSSFTNKKLSSKMVATFISEGVSKEDLGILKKVYGSL